MTIRSCFFLTCLLLFTAIGASAQSRRQPFKLELTALDPKTQRPRSTFVLGEPVTVRISLTNQSRVARSIPVLPDTTIGLKLSAMQAYENGPKITESYVGGTGSAIYSAGMTFWTNRPPRMMLLAPGRTHSEDIADVGEHFVDHPFDEGTYTLTAKYNSGLQASVSFRIVLDEAKTIPLLEELAASASAVNVNDTPFIWANAALKFARYPSISGAVRDTNGRPLKEVTMAVTGTVTTAVETRNDGRYRIGLLREGGTYTITPEVSYYDSPGEERYTIEPKSKTISIADGKVTGVDFIATRIRAGTNVASATVGAKVKASSAQNDDFEIDDTIDEMRFAHVWGYGSGGWQDNTPNVFPDWIEVDFGGVRRINWINVFTLSDNYKQDPEPELNQTFSKYGITDFDVQHWTGRSWRTVPGGAIRGNRNVWRMISFPEIATNKIRVVVRNALGGSSRVTEIEAFHLNDLPQARLTSRTSAHTKSPVHFRSAFSDRDGAIQYYELDFGDDTDAYEWRLDDKKASRKPRLTHSHVYEQEGTYNVRLKVVDDNDEATETTIVLTITDPPKRTTRAP